VLHVLANRTYRHLFVAQAIALLGTGLATVALGLLAYDLAGADAGTVLGTALTIKMVAYVTVSPLVGVVSARLPRRAFLATANTVRAVSALCLPLVSEIWHVYLLILLLQSASAAFTPTFQATIPDVLPDERDYTRALSLSRLAYDLESLASPLLAAALLTVVGYQALFLGTAAGFLGAALLVLSVALPVSSGSHGERSAPFLGFGPFLRVPRLRALLAMNLAVAAATAVVLVNTVVLVRADLGLGQPEVALALGGFGAGSMLVALLLPKTLDRVGDRPVMLPAGFVLAAGLGAAALVLSTMPTQVAWWGLLACWFVLGTGTSLVLTPTGRLLRRSGESQDLPKLFAAQFALSHACFLLTYPLAGWLGPALGQAATLWVFALLAAGAAGGALVLWREPRTVPVD
jgi:MFS family permease